jgi:hypothetical protein
MFMTHLHFQTPQLFSRNVGHEQSSAAPVLQRSDPSRWAPALFDHARALLWGVGQTLATEAIAESIRSGGVWEAESNIELLDLVATPAATNWDMLFTVERINL